MNPSLRIWGNAILVCLLAALVLELRSGAQGFIMIILFMVSFGSLLSLLGFYLLFEFLHALDLPSYLSWPITIIGVPAIVCFNSICLISILDGGFHMSAEHLWREFKELLYFTAIPLTGAIIGIIINVKRIDSYNHPRYTSGL